MATEPELSTAEAKRERRRRRKAAEAAAARAAARRRQARAVIAGIIVVGLAGAGLWFALRSGGEELVGVERPTNEGRDHLAAGATHEYHDPAPTSGPHAPGAPRCGLHQSQLEPTLAVHALEHGAVVLWYQPGLPEASRQSLLDIMRGYESHVILSPNPGIDAEVVATAWNRRKAYEAGDPEIADFVETYRRRGPERVDCPV